MKKKLLFFTSLFLLFQGFLVSCVVGGSMTELITQSKEEQYKAMVPTLFTPDEIKAADTAANVGYLTEEEKKVILFTNLARLDGRRFADDFGERYMGIAGLASSNSYVISFYEDLPKAIGLQLLQPSPALCEAAAYHAEDMGRHGLTGHDSSDGTSFSDRIKRFVPKAGFWSENCSYGTYNNIAIAVVMQLLVDNNVSSLGHRKNILNEEITHIGVAIREHQTDYKYNCVQDFASRIRE